MSNETQINHWLAAMTLEEKVALLAGANFWETVPNERLGIPAIKVTDGPNGARGGGPLVGSKTSAACFPVGVSLASSWNTALVQEVGAALGEETKSKGAQFLLAPTVNIHRSPLNGRNFECYSEDPYLTARIAVAYIEGLQSQNVGATIKHFVGNDSEFERNTISTDVDERTLREIYLPPFEAAVREAKTWAVMSSYNKVNGMHMDGHKELLTDVLKNEWGFDGIVVSDWTGTNSTVESANGGLDLEMPGPARWRGEKLVQAVQNGEVAQDAIDEAARRMLRVILRSGVDVKSIKQPEVANDLPTHRALIRRAGSEGMVLLKNNNALPLVKNQTKHIAVIGPNAASAAIMGGGSSQISAHYVITPLQGLKNALGDGVALEYSLGCTNHKLLPRLAPELLEGKEYVLEYFPNHTFLGPSIHRDTSMGSEQMLLGELAPGLAVPEEVSVRMGAVFQPTVSGQHHFSLVTVGKAKLRINGQVVVDNWDKYQKGDNYFGFGSTEAIGAIDLVANQNCTLELEYCNEGMTLFAAFRLGHLAPVPADAIERAAQAAANADVALVFVGTNGDWETEGSDRTGLRLPGQQDELVARVAAANKNTIVVLQTGGPIVMPWFDMVAAVVQAWFPGQECGNAIADVLFGDVNPSGKLTQTTPKRLEDNPAFLNYPGEHGHVRYGEGIFVGYRFYEKKDVKPFLPFGFGLSYTTFAYANLRLSHKTLQANQTLTLQLEVTNTGQCAGQEIVQVYVRDGESSVLRPVKELKAFAKIDLKIGETKTVVLNLQPRDFAYWDTAQHAWVVEAGRFEVLIGAASNDIRLHDHLEFTETSVLK